jgi:hypothetical protein
VVLLVFLLLASFTLYHYLQGSDPGYIDAPENHDPANDRISRTSNAGRANSAAAATLREDMLSEQVGDTQTGAHEEEPEAAANDDIESMLEWDEFPPMRAVYCRAKEKYVAKFDHFCAILNTAIGERNHCLFWWFLLAQCCVISHTLTIAKTGFDWFAPTRAEVDTSAFAIVLILDFLLLLMGGLLIFHAFLLITSTTTFELFAHEKLGYLDDIDPAVFPFSRSIAYNLKLACWVHGFRLIRYEWTAHFWQRPARLNVESEDVWNNPFHNKYWSCC